MSWTKRDFVLQAFNEAGLASVTFDLTPEQLQSAMRQLDSMMGEWDSDGIRIGWPLSLTPGNADLDTETFAPANAIKAIYKNLAIDIAPAFGKTLSNDTQKKARSAYTTLLAFHSQPRVKRRPSTLPRGAGNKPWRRSLSPFFRGANCR